MDLTTVLKLAEQDKKCFRLADSGPSSTATILFTNYLNIVHYKEFIVEKID